jgi:ribosome biogenesis protein UTP30
VYLPVGRSIYLANLCPLLLTHVLKFPFVQASVEKNARELKLYIEELYWGSGKKVLLLGHSKGGVDAAATLSLYWSELRGKVAGLALVQSPYGGSPVASDILREGQIADKETRRIMELIVCRLIKVLTSLVHLLIKYMNFLC